MSQSQSQWEPQKLEDLQQQERQRPKRPLTIGAGAVVVHEGRVLLVRKAMTAAATMKRLPASSPRWYPEVSATS